MWFIQGFLSLLGRLMLCAIFIMAAVATMIPEFDATVARMNEEGIPSAKIMLIGAITFLILGSLLIIVGYKVRFGAFLLLLFISAATFYFHDFWKLDVEDPGLPNELMHFMKNLGLGGALVYILSNGGGAWSLDSRDEDSADDDEFL